MEACASYVTNVKPDCNTPATVYQILQPIINASTNNQQEAFYVIALDNKTRMLQAPVEVFKGVASACYISAREIFQKALLMNAVSIIIAHNHPSGSLDPSSQDIAITRQIKEAGDIVGIRLLDHIVISKNGYMSFADMGML